ncbi:NAD(+)/NADH kinase [Dactylosporangium sp. CA-092794]|uniref:NAD(+)/NADH kinase n=1 Tax=Dactylosporangium sp. CA-092794 TaxID=3239929 RepID=UPI003D8C94E3
MVNALGLVLHPTKPVDRSIEAILAATAAAGKPLRVLARESDRRRVPPGIEVVPEERFPAEVDGVIALGGDGTMLGAMRLLVDRPVPVLGVNHGNLGFLVEVSPPELPAALSRLAGGDFTIEQYGCLEVGGLELATRYGFNDVVLAREGRTGAVSVDLWVNDVQYGYYRADAVVVATATGSTAYNYAAGGPILSPSSGAIVVTPVAPMAGIGRAVVLGAGDRVTLATAPDSAAIAVDVDGTPAGALTHEGRVTAALRADAAQVVRLSADAHASRSRVKLSLLDLPLRPGQLLDLIPPELRQRAHLAMTGGDDQPTA